MKAWDKSAIMCFVFIVVSNTTKVGPQLVSKRKIQTQQTSTSLNQNNTHSLVKCLPLRQKTRNQQNSTSVPQNYSQHSETSPSRAEDINKSSPYWLKTTHSPAKRLPRGQKTHTQQNTPSKCLTVFSQPNKMSLSQTEDTDSMKLRLECFADLWSRRSWMRNRALDSLGISITVSTERWGIKPGGIFDWRINPGRAFHSRINPGGPFTE